MRTIPSVRYWRRLIAGAALCLAALAALDVLFPPPLARANDLSVIVTDRNGYWLHAFATRQGRWRFTADLDAIDPEFTAELVAIEDQRFWRHSGVDILAAVRAAADAVKARRVVSGASTITMQTARLLEPRKRTVVSKLIEMIRALQIERRLSKHEILELYLTLAPYGGNIEGVRAASLIYFGKEPETLAVNERALLIALPQAPEARRPDRRPTVARAARNEILNRLAAVGLVEPAIAAEIEDDGVPRTRRRFPQAAYHVSYQLARQEKPAGEPVRAAIDIRVQTIVERLLEERAREFADGATAAAIVIDNESNEVLASVGSSSLDAPGGWIDLTDRQRSPGSLLKPFVYGLAFEDGALGPDTVLDDMPRGFSGYNPENFDRTFRGEVRVREALQHSLNVPAVAALDRVGVVRFREMLAAAGARIALRKKAESRPSLALVLGGGGLTMREIAALYAGLSRGGGVQPLHWTVDGEKKDQPAYQLFSPATAGQINAILRGAPSLAGRAPAALSTSAPVVAFKTGTSYGFRDAWAAGHAGGKTIVVWVGRADGAPRPGMAGRNTAAPILFDLFDALTDASALSFAESQTEGEENTVRVRLAPPISVAAPSIKFPVPGSEIFPDASGDDRGVALAASGGEGGYRWYVDGVEVAVDPEQGRAIWRPQAPGFYDITVADARGAAGMAKVRVVSLQ